VDPVKRLLVALVAAAYLCVGALVAVRTQPGYTWVCPDAGAPHGQVTYGGVENPPADDCHSGVGKGDRIGEFVSTTLSWPLVAAAARSDA